MKTITAYYQDFITYMKAKNRSSLTIKDYKMYFKAFHSFTGDITPDKITTALVDGFERTLVERKLEPTTVSYYLIFIRSFLKYLVRQDIKTLNYQKIELPKVQRKILPALNEAEIKQLIKVVPISMREGLRAKAVILFLLTSGCRVQEMCTLKVTDLELEEHRATIIGKGNKMRVVFFDGQTAYYLKKYLQDRRIQSSYVFTQEDNRGFQTQPITTRSIQRLLKKYSQRAGISKICSPHTLRRTFASRLLRKGVNIKALKELMGHEQIETTSRYIFIEQDELKRIHQLAHRKSVKNVKEKEMVIVSRETLQKLTGTLSRTLQQQNRIIRKMEGKEESIVEKPISLPKTLTIN